jgi:hypothetical protein
MEEVIASGKADVVEVARALFAIRTALKGPRRQRR